ncbi:hypothetical protein ACPWSH_24325, partial [Pandoraea pneumonica]|uniref:hypothetical protein n=1 Tax=Pandoraea pneumonica TaxID=2508299 RepID=UPI003CFB2121
STFPVDSVLGYNIPLLGSERLDAGTPAGKTFKLLAGVVLPAGYVLGQSITVESVAGPGQTLTEKLDTLLQDTYTQADWYIAPGSPEGNYFDQLLGGL